MVEDFFANRIPHNIELLISLLHRQKPWPKERSGGISQAATTIPAQEKNNCSMAYVLLMMKCWLTMESYMPGIQHVEKQLFAVILT
jgi:hypothetical protein